MGFRFDKLKLMGRIDIQKPYGVSLAEQNHVKDGSSRMADKMSKIVFDRLGIKVPEGNRTKSNGSKMSFITRLGYKRAGIIK